VKKLLSRTIKEFRAAAFAYLASTLVIALGLTVFSFFGLIYFNLVHFTEEVAKELVLNVYLKPETNFTAAQNLIFQLEKNPLVAKVSFVPPEKVLEDLKQLFEEKELLSGVEAKFLPPVLLVSFKDPFEAAGKLKALSAEIAQNPVVLKVQFAKSWLMRLANIKRFLEIFSLSGLLLVGLATCFVIGLVVSFSLAQRERELEILSLVGATPGFIQGPVILIAAIEGLLASAFATGLVYTLKIYLEDAIKGFFPGFSGKLLFWNEIHLTIITIGVIALCMAGSYWASRRYLRY